MPITIPIYQDISDYFLVKTKTISRIAIADIMDDKMLIKWYEKLLQSQKYINKLKGIGYFESSYSHGFVMSTKMFNKIALQVIKFQLDIRNLNIRSSFSISSLELLEKEIFL